MNLRSIKFNPAEKLTPYYILISTFATFYFHEIWNRSSLPYRNQGVDKCQYILSRISWMYPKKSSINFIRYLLLAQLVCLLVSRNILLQPVFWKFWSPVSTCWLHNVWFSAFSDIFADLSAALVLRTDEFGISLFFPLLIITCLYFYHNDRKYAEFFFFTTILAFFVLPVVFTCAGIRSTVLFSINW